MDAQVTPRRERVRTETTAEIKARAWALMESDGVDALSLRELTRQMGMAPSALYRYFGSRSDLLTALIIDGFTSLADTISRTHEVSRTAGLSALDTWLAVADAYRGWAKSNPAVFGVIYSNCVPDYTGTPGTTAAASQVGHSLLAIMADLLDEGLIDLETITAEIEGPLTEQLAVWSTHGGQSLPPAALAAAIRCYAMLHGLVHLEVNGHYPVPLHDSDALFRSTIRALTVSLGLVR